MFHVELMVGVDVHYHPRTVLLRPCNAPALRLPRRCNATPTAAHAAPTAVDFSRPISETHTVRECSSWVSCPSLGCGYSPHPSFNLSGPKIRYFAVRAAATSM